MIPGNPTIQARIPTPLKQQLTQRSAELGVTITEVITKGVEAFVVHGRWWEDEEEESSDASS